jgi:hypothetical protein
MSITSIKEDYQARETTGTMNTNPMKGVVVHKRRWVVTTNNVADDGALIYLAPGLPRPFDPHPNDPNAFVNSVAAKPRQNSPTIWEVLVGYTSDMPTPKDGTRDGKIQLRPTKYGIGYTTISRVMDLSYDLKDNGSHDFTIPVMNSAGEPLADKPDREIYLKVYTVEFIDTFDSFAVSICGGVNKNAFTVNGVNIPAQQALGRVRQTPFFEAATAYWTTSVELVINPSGWAITPLDMGTRKINPDPATGSTYSSGAKIVEITDQFGQQLHKPAFLDGFGKQLPMGSAAPVKLDGTHGKSDLGPFMPYQLRIFPSF